MQDHYTVQLDSKGYVLIPAALRKSLGIGPKSLLILSQEGSELRLMPGEVKRRREVRMYSNAEIAQALIDGAVTAEGVNAANESIRELGLNPDDFHANL